MGTVRITLNAGISADLNINGTTANVPLSYNSFGVLAHTVLYFKINSNIVEVSTINNSIYVNISGVDIPMAGKTESQIIEILKDQVFTDTGGGGGNGGSGQFTDSEVIILRQMIAAFTNE